MKIAFLTPEYPHPETGNSGGIGTSIKTLSKALIADANEVIIMVYGQKADAVFYDGKIKIYQIKNVKIKGLSWFFTRMKIRRMISKLYAEGAIDLVEAPDWTGITSFIKTACPIIIRLHGSDTYFCHLDKRPVKRINRFHEKRALLNADAIVSVSRFTANVTSELFGLQSNITVIPNAVDISQFNGSQLVDDNTILYFGSLIRKKGLLELPYIFNEVIVMNPDAKLILLGKDVPDAITGGISTWEIMQPMFIPEALKNVDYKGAVPFEAVKGYIEKAAVCVFPSFAEALPVSWLEAMAMKKAIVASDIGWAKEIITDGKDGFLVHPENHKAFALKIRTLLDNAELMTTFGETARRKTAINFATGIISQKNTDFYKNTITTK